MALILTIENETSLPNGAPVSVRITDRRNFDIGRGAHLDWTLPDPTRFISGKHCEVRYRDDGYWVYDVSTNGTFLNDSPRRLQAPYRLCSGDRLTIGSYVILVTLETEDEQAIVELDNDVSAHVPPERASSALDESSKTPPSERHPPPLPHIETSNIESQDLAGSAPGWKSAAVIQPPPVPEPKDTFVPLEEEAMPASQEAASEREYPFEAARSAPPIRDEIAPREAAPAPSAQNAAAAEPRFAEELGGRISMPPLPVPPSRPAAAPETKASTPAPERHLPRAVSPPVAASPETDDAAAASEQPDLDEFFRRFAAGAGIPEHVFARRDRLEVAEELGAVMRIVAENLKQLLSARYEAKRFTRTASQTMIQALDNNPLKFAPTAEDALRIMLGPKTRSYLDARSSLDGAFHDLKTHQIKTFSAMQGAVKMLIDDFDPQQIDAAAGPSTGVSGWLISRKARLWDLFLARWQAKSLRHKDGLVDAFMLYFSECYDRASDKS